MRPRLVMAGLAGAVFLLDQATKLWVRAALPLNTFKPVTSFLNLVHVRNPGSAFGFLSESGAYWLMLILSASGLVVLIVWGFRSQMTGWLSRVGFSLAWGGAAGNLVDRLVHREVIDFLDFYLGTWHWWAFNVADAALTAGFAALAWTWGRQPRPIDD